VQIDAVEQRSADPVDVFLDQSGLGVGAPTCEACVIIKNICGGGAIVIYYLVGDSGIWGFGKFRD
jgi:hypothetical protein